MKEPAKNKKLSIIIPVYNEERTVLESVRRVAGLPVAVQKEIIIVDDGSTDSTPGIIKNNFSGEKEIKIITLPTNGGRGAALRRGFASARGDILVLQDADLEYDPNDIPALIKPILEGNADIVCGSRFSGKNIVPSHYLGFRFMNRVITLFTNWISGYHLSDVYGCYKAFSRGSWNAISPYHHSNHFEFDVEALIIAGRLKLKIGEVPISYHGRSYAEGKKLNFLDGLRVILCAVRLILKINTP